MRYIKYFNETVKTDNRLEKLMAKHAEEQAKRDFKRDAEEQAKRDAEAKEEAKEEAKKRSQEKKLSKIEDIKEKISKFRYLRNFAIYYPDEIMYIKHHPELSYLLSSLEKVPKNQYKKVFREEEFTIEQINKLKQYGFYPSYNKVYMHLDGKIFICKYFMLDSKLEYYEIKHVINKYNSLGRIHNNIIYKTFGDIVDIVENNSYYDYYN